MGEKDIRLMKEVVDLLKGMGVDASVEYPGYIAVAVPGRPSLSFGTAGGDWGWNDEDGRESGELGLSWREKDPSRIASRIAEAAQQLSLPLKEAPSLKIGREEALKAAEQFRLRASASRIRKAALVIVALHEMRQQTAQFMDSLKAEARAYTDEHFNSPTQDDYLVIENAFLRGAAHALQKSQAAIKASADDEIEREYLEQIAASAKTAFLLLPKIHLEQPDLLETLPYRDRIYLLNLALKVMRKPELAGTRQWRNPQTPEGGPSIEQLPTIEEAQSLIKALTGQTFEEYEGDITEPA